MTWKRNVLVVANVTATSRELLDALARTAAREPCSFTLLVPATAAGGGFEAASQQLSDALAQMRDMGLVAQGAVGNADPIVAVSEIWEPGAPRRDHRRDAAAQLLEVAARRSAGADRQAHRRACHTSCHQPAKADGERRPATRATRPSTGPPHRARVGQLQRQLRARGEDRRRRTVHNQSLMTVQLGHIITAMVTPFDTSGQIDEGAAVRLMHHLIDHGSDGLVICGTTGEASTLDDREHLRMIELAVGEMAGRCTIIAGVGSNDTRHAVALTEHATELRRRRAAVGQPLLQPAEPPRDRPPLRGGRARHRPPDRALQHPAADRFRHAQRPARRARAARQHRCASSRPTPRTSRRSTACRSTPATTTCSPTCSISASPVGSSPAATCSATRCDACSTSPSAGARSTRACRTSTATSRSRRPRARSRRR